MTNKDYLKFISKPENYKFVCDSPNDAEKRKRIQKLKSEFESQTKFFSINVSNSGNAEFYAPPVNFSSSGYVEDSTGIPDLLNDDFSQERAETGLIEIQRHLIQEDLKESLTGYLNARNSVIKRNRERKADIQKEFLKNS